MSNRDSIHCPHCGKRYPLTPALRAMAGRLGRCAACRNSFPILIAQTGSLAAGQQVATAPHLAAKEPMPDKSMPNRRNRRGTRHIPVVGAAMLLILALAHIQFDRPNNPENPTNVVRTSDKPNKPLAATSPLPTAIEPKIDSKSGDDVYASEEEAVAEEEILANESALCRQSAIGLWETDFRLTHERMSTEQFSLLLDQSISLTRTIREQCRNEKLATTISRAAKTGRHIGSQSDPTPHTATQDQ